MKVVFRKDIDMIRWDALVDSSSENACFSKGYYMDAICKNWLIFVDESYETGIAFQYKKVGFFKIILTPNFARYSEWFGQKSASSLLQLKQCISKFDAVQIQLKENLSFDNMTSKRFQQVKLKSDDFKLGSMVLKHAKKAIDSGIEIRETFDKERFFQIVEVELGPRDREYLFPKLQVLVDLVNAAEKAGVLKTMSVYSDNEFVGATLWIHVHNQKMLYLKGIVTDAVKKKGAMHLLFSRVFLKCQADNITIDFGGSNIEGIANFFRLYGGKDEEYFSFVHNKWIFEQVKKVVKILKRG